MPKWNVHLEVARRVNNVFNFCGEKKEQFIIGNILPDINNGYLVTTVHKKIEHNVTHIDSVNENAVLKFAQKYKKYIQEKNPIVLGYLLHLYTDKTFNDNFYRDVSDKWPEGVSRDEQRIIKQRDFGVFDKKYDDVTDGIEFVYKSLDVDASKVIDEVEINEDDLETALQCIYAWKKMEVQGEYEICDDKMLEGYLDKTVNDFLSTVCEDVKCQNYQK